MTAPGESQPTEVVDVFLLEGDPGQAESVLEMLRLSRRLHSKVVRVRQLRSAVTALGQSTPDILLLDATFLRPTQGMVALEKIQSAAPGVPTIVLAEADDEETALEAMRSGAQDYVLNIRTDPELLARVILHAMERKRWARDLEEKERLLTSFQEIGEVTSSSLDLDEILDSLVARIVESGIFRSLMIALVNETMRSVEVVRYLSGAAKSDAGIPEIAVSSTRGISQIHRGAPVIGSRTSSASAAPPRPSADRSTHRCPRLHHRGLVRPRRPKRPPAWPQSPTTA